jgi:hypothetical protein
VFRIKLNNLEEVTMEKITLTWADKFRELIEVYDGDSESIVNEFLKYADMQEQEVSQRMNVSLKKLDKKLEA